jgi:LysM repeat protein
MAGNGGRVVAVSEPPRLIERGRAKTWVPSAAGLVGLYAARLEQRGVDLRWLIAERRAALDGIGRPATRRPGRAAVSHCEVIAVGRGTERHHAAVRGQHAAPRRALPRTGWGAWRPTARRRLATATIAAIVAFGGLAPVVTAQDLATAQDDISQYRYVVQPGDTVESVATMFGVDPAAILAASAVQNPLELIPSEVIVIPDQSLLPAVQRQQEVAGNQSQVAEGARNRQGDAEKGRHHGREHGARHDRTPRAGLRVGQEDQSPDPLLPHQGLRPRQPVGEGARLRHDRTGAPCAWFSRNI